MVDRWEVKDPKNWIFHLCKDIKFHNGAPLTAEDVVHSINRIRTDPLSKQRQNIAAVASEAVIDQHTVRITTKEPTAPLLDYLFDRTMITNAGEGIRILNRVCWATHPRPSDKLHVDLMSPIGVARRIPTFFSAEESFPALTA